MKAPLWLFLILLPALLFAQPPDTLWTQTLDWPGYGVRCYSILPTSDGGCVFAVNYNVSNSGEMTLVKLDSTGEAEWMQVYSAHLLEGRALLQAGNGDFLVAGNAIVSSSGPYQVWLMRTNSSGDSLWSRTYSAGDYTLAACLLPNGDIAIGGQKYSSAIDDQTASLLRVSPQGDSLWSWNADTANVWCGSSINAMTSGPAGGIVTAGYDQHRFTHEYMWEFKEAWVQYWQADGSRGTMWSRSLRDMDQYTAIAPLANGGYVLAGTSENDYVNRQHLLLTLLDGSGGLRWSRLSSFGYVSSVCNVFQVGDIFLVVGTARGISDEIPSMWAFNARGDSLWMSTCPDMPTRAPVASTPTADGGVISVTTNSAWTEHESIRVTRLAPLPPQSTLSVGPPTVEFDQVAIGGTARDTVQIVNTDTVSVTVTAISVSGNYVCDAGLPHVVEPHGTWIVPVRFMPQAAGDATGNVQVTATTAHPPAVVHLHGTGIVAPPVEWSFNPHAAPPRTAAIRSVAALELSGNPHYALVGNGWYSPWPYHRTVLATFGPAGDSTGSYNYMGPDSTDCTPLVASAVGDTTLICEGPSARMLRAVASNGTSLWRTAIQPVLTYLPTISVIVPLTNGDGYLVAGRTEYSNTPLACCPLFIRTTRGGDTLWTREIQELRGDWCTAVKEIPDGWLIAGPCHTWPIDGGGFFMARLTETGDTLWSRRYRAPNALRKGACFAADGSVLFFGEDSVGNHLADAFLVKAAANGDSLWARHFGGDGADRCRCAAATSDGGFAIGGETSSLGPQDGTYNIWLFKVSGDGDSLWSEPLSFKHKYESCNAILTTSDGGLLACATALGSVITDSNSTVTVDALIYKLSPTLAGTTRERTDAQPRAYRLSQNYPNPFNPTTRISFELPKAGVTTLKVYNLLGREVATLLNGNSAAGEHTVPFDGSRLASGIYFYRLESGAFSATRKMLLLK